MRRVSVPIQMCLRAHHQRVVKPSHLERTFRDVGENEFHVRVVFIRKMGAQCDGDTPVIRVKVYTCVTRLFCCATTDTVEGGGQHPLAGNLEAVTTLTSMLLE